MNAIRTSFTFRAATVFVVFFGWLVLSNHCAISAALAELEVSAETSCCKSVTKPVSSQGPCPDMPQGCCKTLKIAMPDAAKIPTLAVVMFVPVFAEALIGLGHARVTEVAASPAIGPPPDVPAFAELVLNRSLHSHAPPVLA